MIVLSAFSGVLVTAFWNMRKKNAEREVRMNEMEKKLALVDAAVVPISTAFQAILIKELTHFHTPEMDDLMQKIGPPNTLSEEEEKRLVVLLKERTTDMGPLISDSERDAAFILPAVMARAKQEQEALSSAEVTDLVTMVVGIPVAKSGSTKLEEDKSPDSEGG